MGGGLMQLVAYGAQDIYLTANAQITFFKVVYRRHTNFSMEAIEQTIDGSVNFGSRLTSTISRNGDLITDLYVEWSPSKMCQNFASQSGNSLAQNSFTAYAGNTLLKDVELQIGGQKIDKIDRRWMSIWGDLTSGDHTNAGDLYPAKHIESYGAVLPESDHHNGLKVGNYASKPEVDHISKFRCSRKHDKGATGGIVATSVLESGLHVSSTSAGVVAGTHVELGTVVVYGTTDAASGDTNVTGLNGASDFWYTELMGLLSQETFTSKTTTTGNQNWFASSTADYDGNTIQASNLAGTGAITGTGFVVGAQLSDTIEVKSLGAPISSTKLSDCVADLANKDHHTLALGAFGQLGAIFSGTESTMANGTAGKCKAAAANARITTADYMMAVLGEVGPSESTNSVHTCVDKTIGATGDTGSATGTSAAGSIALLYLKTSFHTNSESDTCYACPIAVLCSSAALGSYTTGVACGLANVWTKHVVLSLELDTSKNGAVSGIHTNEHDIVRSPPPVWNKNSFNINAAPQGRWPSKVQKAYVPLPFWFTKNPGLALPLIALQYHEVKVIMNLSSKADMLSVPYRNLDSGSDLVLDSADFQLWVNYVYLDTPERRRFASISHEYLIEQVQHYEQQFSTPMSQATIQLNFNHPVKELVFGTVCQDGEGHRGIGPSLLQNAPGSLLDNRNYGTKVTLKLNGHERFAPRHPSYFSGQQVLDHHSGSSGLVCKDSIHVYSFALKPEEHQPSGTCNFSRIDNAQLVITGASQGTTNAQGNSGKICFDQVMGHCPSWWTKTSQTIVVYAVNYNVLRIMSGMGGLAYSN